MKSIQRVAFCRDYRQLIDVLSSFVIARKVLLVHGHKSYWSCGAKALIDDFFSHLGTEIVEFDNFSENPKKEDVDKGIALLIQESPEMIISVGGGSVMDMAKLMRFYSHLEIPLLAVPTTAGTGAESTQFAVCYIDGVKHSINDPSILPDSVILYPPFTYQNSLYLTSCTGFDALAQAIESFWNIHATKESDTFALSAIYQIFPILGKERLSPEDRSALMLGANDAGKAINITRTTVPHALSYTLTSKYGYPHGHAVALCFPFFFNYYLEGKANAYRGDDYENYLSKMNLLRSLLNVGQDPFMFMKEYIHRLGLGFDPIRDFEDHVVAHGLNAERAGNTPIAINEEVILMAVKSIRY